MEFFYQTNLMGTKSITDKPYLIRILTACWLDQHSLKYVPTAVLKGREKSISAWWIELWCRWYCTAELRCKSIMHQIFSSNCLQAGSCPTEDTRCHTPHLLWASMPGTSAARLQLPASGLGHPPKTLEEGNGRAPSTQLVPSAFSILHL